MTLTNYWWLLIWLFLGGAIFSNIPKRRERLNGRTVERWDFWPAILMVVPYIIWAGCRDWSFGDSLVYQKGYREAAAGLQAAISFFVDGQKDKVVIAALRTYGGGEAGFAMIPNPSNAYPFLHIDYIDTYDFNRGTSAGLLAKIDPRIEQPAAAGISASSRHRKTRKLPEAEYIAICEECSNGKYT